MEPHRISHVHDVKCIPTHQTIPLVKSWLRLQMKLVICSLLSFLKSKQLPLLLGFLKNFFFFSVQWYLGFSVLSQELWNRYRCILSPCSSPKISPYPHGHTLNNSDWISPVWGSNQKGNNLSDTLFHITILDSTQVHHHNLVWRIKSLLTKRRHCILSDVQTMIQILWVCKSVQIHSLNCDAKSFHLFLFTIKNIKYYYSVNCWNLNWTKIARSVAVISATDLQEDVITSPIYPKFNK